MRQTPERTMAFYSKDRERGEDPELERVLVGRLTATVHVRLVWRPAYAGSYSFPHSFLDSHFSRERPVEAFVGVFLCDS